VVEYERFAITIETTSMCTHFVKLRAIGRIEFEDGKLLHETLLYSQSRGNDIYNSKVYKITRQRSNWVPTQG